MAGLLSTAFPAALAGVGSEAEYPGLELCLTWSAGTARGSLMCYATVVALYTIYL